MYRVPELQPQIIFVSADSITRWSNFVPSVLQECPENIAVSLEGVWTWFLVWFSSQYSAYSWWDWYQVHVVARQWVIELHKTCEWWSGNAGSRLRPWDNAVLHRPPLHLQRVLILNIAQMLFYMIEHCTLFIGYPVPTVNRPTTAV